MPPEDFTGVGFAASTRKLFWRHGGLAAWRFFSSTDRQPKPFPAVAFRCEESMGAFGGRH
jgi:hypothetical protein